MISAIYYELTVALITTPILAIFIFLIHEEPAKRHTPTIYRLTTILGILWIYFTTQLFTEFW